MAFNVNSFLQNLVKGGARPNQFDITLPFPSGTNDAMADMTFMAHASSLPGQDVGIINVGYFGRFIKVPGDRSFSEWTVTIYNDEDFWIRNAFEQWSESINNHVANLRDGDKLLFADYARNATVTQYGKTGDIIKTYNMFGCWPANVSAIETAWDQTNTIESFTITFAYQWWESDTTDNSATAVVI